MFEDEVRVFVHPDLVVLWREIPHDNIVGASCPLIIAARSGINSAGAVFLFGTKRHNLNNGCGYVSENARFFKEIAGNVASPNRSTGLLQKDLLQEQAPRSQTED